MTDFEQLCAIVARLRGPGGCPWDREQTNATLAPALIEETYEVVNAIRANDDANLREELGDALLLIVMHAEIAREQGRFEICEILSDVTEKLIRRHPHVFGDSRVDDAGGVVRQWEAIKQTEKKDRPLRFLDDLPQAFPALMRAQKAQKKVARVNFDWNEIADVMAKVDEELTEVKKAMAAANRQDIAEEIGDLLFALVNLARKQKFDAETLLQSATDKFVRRFHVLEEEVRIQGKTLGEIGLEELDAIWNAQKAGRARPVS